MAEERRGRVFLRPNLRIGWSAPQTGRCGTHNNAIAFDTSTGQRGIFVTDSFVAEFLGGMTYSFIYLLHQQGCTGMAPYVLRLRIF
jgi:hypothetical protein